MIAQLFVLAPFTLSVPQATEFALYQFDADGYKVVVFPPKRRTENIKDNESLFVKIDGTAAVQGDVIHIDFIKPDFDRRADNPDPERLHCDPPLELIQAVLDSYILRLRHVTRAAAIRPFSFQFARWKLRYLNDDGSELEKREGLARGRSALTYVTALTMARWNDIHSLPVDYEPPPWDALVLDAAVP